MAVAGRLVQGRFERRAMHAACARTDEERVVEAERLVHAEEPEDARGGEECELHVKEPVGEGEGLDELDL